MATKNLRLEYFLLYFFKENSFNEVQLNVFRSLPMELAVKTISNYMER